jgi:deferrochelatase/peroxidase EfeB
MDTDPDGLACPVGAHIRRANPRDSLDMPPSRSVLVSRRHRLIRRGRKFLSPTPTLDQSPNPPSAISFFELCKAVAYVGNAEQGLFFIALNADLRRQYEFVQQLWINDPSFNGLDNDRDPLIGDNSTDGEFTIQAEPINRHLRGLPRFVTMKGGGYFFLPGIRAIRFLANYKP